MKPRIIWVSLILALAMLLGACGGEQAPSSPARGDPAAGDSPEGAGQVASTLNFGLSTEPAHLNIHTNGGQAVRAVSLNIYRGLFSYKGGQVTNELCESYEVADDDKTYTFRLRDARFHNGDPVTAGDVAFTLHYILDPDHGATYRTEMSVIDSVSVLDDRTVQVVLSEPCAPFLHYLAMPEAGILSESWVADHPDLTAAPMGAGPYRFVSWESGQYIQVERFAQYYKEGLPKTDAVRFHFYADDDARVNALRTQDVEIIEFTPWKDIPMLENDDRLETLTEYAACMALVLNPDYAPLADEKVRQAIAFAVDRQKLINTAFSGRGREAGAGPVASNFPGYSEALESSYTYDPDRARQLLAEAGYADGFDLTILATSTYAMHSDTAISIQDDLKNIGINVELNLPDWATRQSLGIASDYQSAIVGMTLDYADPDCLSTYFYGGVVNANHPIAFDDPALNALFDQGRSTLDEAEREEIYAKLYDRLLALSPAAFGMWRDQSYTMHKSVNNFENLAGALTIFSPICLEDVTVSR